jgi:hypothetical protein
MPLWIEGWRSQQTWEYCEGDDNGFNLPLQYCFAMLVQDIAYAFMMWYS